jgi:hypothetical protein
LAHFSELFHENKGRYGSSVPLERQPKHPSRLTNFGNQVQPEQCGSTDEGTKLGGAATRKFVATTDSCHTVPIAQNLLNREYQVEAVAGLDQAWAGDITYVPTAQGWLYVAGCPCMVYLVVKFG